jgi:hypothetical protein
LIVVTNPLSAEGEERVVERSTDRVSPFKRLASQVLSFGEDLGEVFHKNMNHLKHMKHFF